MESHRAAGVEDEIAAKIGVGLEFAQVEAIGPPVDTPVEAADVIARNVLAILGKLDAGAFMRTLVVPGDSPLHGHARLQGLAHEASKHVRFEEVEGGVQGE